MIRLYGITPAQAVPGIVAIQQLPTYPVPPPVGGEALGLLSWDQPEMVLYTPGTEISAYVEMSNPTAENKLYAVSYYFLDPQGVVASEGYVKFLTDSLEFTCFYLPPQAPEPAFFEIGFSASEVDYVFGLRLLLAELVNDTANIVQECSRVQVLLASQSTWDKYKTPSSMSDLVGAMMVVMMMGMMTQSL